jgi:hypothetical protein
VFLRGSVASAQFAISAFFCRKYAPWVFTVASSFIPDFLEYIFVLSEIYKQKFCALEFW